jgi:hypothetical protein
MTVSQWVEPDYVDEGMEVLAPYDNKGTGVRCRVECAAGKHARVVNERRGIDKWFHLSDLRVAKEGST